MFLIKVFFLFVSVCGCLTAVIKPNEVLFENVVKINNISRLEESILESIQNQENFNKSLNISLTDGNKYITALINEWIDKIYVRSDLWLQKLGVDPLNLPDQKKVFKKKVMFITYKGELSFLNNVLTGASTLRRNGDTKVIYTLGERVMRIEFPIFYDKFQFNSKYKAKFMGIGPRGKLTATMKDMRIMVVLTIDFALQQAELTEYKITKAGKISVKFHGGIGLLDWWPNLISKFTTAFFHNTITSVVSSIVEKSFRDFVEIINEILYYI